MFCKASPVNKPNTQNTNKKGVEAAIPKSEDIQKNLDAEFSCFKDGEVDTTGAVFGTLAQRRVFVARAY